MVKRVMVIALIAIGAASSAWAADWGTWEALQENDLRLRTIDLYSVDHVLKVIVNTETRVSQLERRLAELEKAR